MTILDDPTCHPGCEGERRGNVHRAQFCIFCLRAIGDAATLRVDTLETALARLHEWTCTFGAELKPPGADTYGEGVRDSKARVASIISSSQRTGSGLPERDAK